METSLIGEFLTLCLYFGVERSFRLGISEIVAVVLGAMFHELDGAVSDFQNPLPQTSTLMIRTHEPNLLSLLARL
jgi:hypothetical protein